MNNFKTIIKIIMKITLFCFYILTHFIKFSWKFIDKVSSKFRIKFRFSISFKITTVYVSIFSLIFFLLSTAVLLGFGIFLNLQVQNKLIKDSEIFKIYAKENSQISNQIIKALCENDNISVRVFDEKRRSIYNYGEVISDFYYKLDSIHTIKIDGKSIMVLNNKIELKDKIIYVQISKDLSKEKEYLGLLLYILISLNIIILIIIIIFGSRASKKMLRPIDKMTETAKEISVYSLDRRLDVSYSHDELKELAQTFNDMLDRIQQSYEQQNQFVSDASHELRTPIAVIQGYANLLDRWGKNDKEVLEESIGAIKNEAENMKDLVEKLLFLARSDKNTQKIEKENFYINELIDEVIKETKLIESNYKIINEHNEKIIINADRKLIKQALRIFVDNSIKFTPENGYIKINTFLENRNLLIIVEDNGIGIAKEDLPFIFNRFYRADKSRTKKSGGTGLGLAIAKWIIYKHNGGILVESRLNYGTKIKVTLPLLT
ncbi:HAMP domain-containing sensor histidine kinase [Clostridium sp. DJ247]|uniref:HAMP domain-containing sensor histidine kinase n=1 Tax=Clostridium sp. DJ247 TaxID=2726188 RepID=UPI0016259B30|nr:HAMP domain-containing sensor histidine kinase [Clostridium sp. DJ247]MBC2578779.1 HAMP domain-containing histidine kinase [Clostridium sp. DJ247]